MVIRRGDRAEDRAQLIHAARILVGLDHPGVECFVALEDDGRRTRLVTAFPGARTLADAPPEDPDGLVRTAAGILAALAAIHRAGIVHGRISPDRIRIGPGGRPVLCDFRSAERPSPDTLDRARRDELAAVGRLLGELTDAIEVRPFRHPRTWLRLRSCARSCRRLVEARAHSGVTVRGPDAPRRPRRPTVPGRPGPGTRPTRRPLLRYTTAALLGAAGIASIVTGLRGIGAAPAAAPPHPPIPEASVHDNVIRAAGLTYRVGRPGDRVVLGDWDGDGVLTPAVLRPADGSVFVHEAWPAPDVPVDGPPVTHLRGATDLRVRSGSEGHDILEAVDPEGSTVVRTDRTATD